MTAKKCKEAQPGKAVSAFGGSSGTVLKSRCANCGKPIEKQHAKNGKAVKEWTHVTT